MRVLDYPSFNPGIKNDTVLYCHYREIPKECLQGIKYLVTPCSGTDHIDFEYCLENGIEVIYLDDKEWLYKNVHATAEHTMFLMLAGLKMHTKRESGYNSELYRKSVGIIGYGRIGQQVKRLVEAFGAQVETFDKDSIAGIDDIFEVSDIITIHIPYNQDTKTLIKRSVVQKFIGGGGMIVNVSRSKLIPGDFEKYGDVEIVRSKGKLFCTNHMAGFTKESRMMTDYHVFEKLKGRLRNSNNKLSTFNKDGFWVKGENNGV